jgi:SAM-dependent methyltransferase
MTNYFKLELSRRVVKRINKLVFSLKNNLRAISERHKRRMAFTVLRRSKVLEIILEPILRNSIETAWIRYTEFLSQTDKKHALGFSRSDILPLIPFIRPLKARYYEFLISLFGLEQRSMLDDLLYGSGYDITHFRSRLMFSDNTQQNDFYLNRMEEYQKIFGFIPKLLDKHALMEKFEKNKNNTADLFKIIQEQHSQYFARKMLLPTFQDLLRIKALLGKRLEDSKLRILDYGCGGADCSLYLATYGHDITLCDVGGMLDKAQQRFAIRGFPVESIYAEAEASVPPLEGQWDLVLAIEVLEHIFNPFELLELIDRVCAPGGIILLGSFPFVATNAYGDHVASAVSRREEMKQWIETRWKRIRISDLYSNAFRKKS